MAMRSSILDTYITSVASEEGSTPAMMDEFTLLSLLSNITGHHLISYESLKEIGPREVFLYDIPEDKKEFNIETIRRCIIDIELRPYTGKNIYVLRHFSTATIQAQNALLKILEECPRYAIILLEVDNPNSILETIRSRVIDFTKLIAEEPLSSIGKEVVEAYKNHDHKKLTQSLYGIKCTSLEAVKILQSVYPYLEYKDMSKCDTAIEDLMSTHENPKSILDVFFIG